MGYFDPLEKELQHYLDQQHIALIKQAYLVAKHAHQGQKRRSGEPYITHPVAAALMLANIRMDHQSIMATLLHDVIEDTPVTKEELINQFGKSVADLVDGVSKLTQIKFATQAEAQAENFRKMVMAMVRDIRVIIVKLADRLHNMRTLTVLPTEKRHRIAIETLEIYAPIANRLGMHNFYIELEDLGFSTLYPMRARILKKAVQKARGNRDEIMKKIRLEIESSLANTDIPVLTIIGRKKHLYSIYKKMRQKETKLSDIMDVYGFRIITDNIDNCYRILGVIHQAYKPLPTRFKDYIAISKVNGYQSLHTTLFGPYGVPIEVQIRTEDMNRVAENGIAAHWLYKSTGLEASDTELRAHQWAKGLLEMQKSAITPQEFIENVKIDLFPDEVYVFTPDGEILELPRGATPVDFAYTIHSDIGDTCVAAKVNRHLAPLSKPLKNGQTVEIITAPGASPNPAWLNFIVTGKARSRVRHFLKVQQEQELVSLGKRLLENSLLSFSSHLDDIAQKNIEQVLQQLNYKNTTELYKAISSGHQIALLVARRLTQHYAKEDLPPQQQQALAIKGTEGLVVNYADCCQPIPGDIIVGYLQPGQGIMVHTDVCPRIEKLRQHPERLISMCWEDNIIGQYPVNIQIIILNQRGSLAQLAALISEAEADISHIQTLSEGDTATLNITLTVRGRKHLAQVIRRLRTNHNILKVHRKNPT